MPPIEFGKPNPNSTFLRTLDVFIPVIGLGDIEQLETRPNFNLRTDKITFRDATAHLFSDNNSRQTVIFADVDDTLKPKRKLTRPGMMDKSDLTYIQAVNSLPNVNLIAITDGPERGYQYSRLWSLAGRRYSFVPRCFEEIGVHFQGTALKDFNKGLGFKQSNFGLHFAVNCFEEMVRSSTEVDQIIVIGNRGTDMVYGIDVCTALYDRAIFRNKFDCYWIGRHNGKNR